jgi:hypothetical protein
MLILDFEIIQLQDQKQEYRYSRQLLPEELPLHLSAPNSRQIVNHRPFQRIFTKSAYHLHMAFVLLQVIQHQEDTYHRRQLRLYLDKIMLIGQHLQQFNIFKYLDQHLIEHSYLNTLLDFLIVFKLWPKVLEIELEESDLFRVIQVLESEEEVGEELLGLIVFVHFERVGCG